MQLPHVSASRPSYADIARRSTHTQPTPPQKQRTSQNASSNPPKDPVTPRRDGGITHAARRDNSTRKSHNGGARYGQIGQGRPSTSNVNPTYQRSTSRVPVAAAPSTPSTCNPLLPSKTSPSSSTSSSISAGPTKSSIPTTAAAKTSSSPSTTPSVPLLAYTDLEWATYELTLRALKMWYTPSSVSYRQWIARRNSCGCRCHGLRTSLCVRSSAIRFQLLSDDEDGEDDCRSSFNGSIREFEMSGRRRCAQCGDCAVWERYRKRPYIIP